jgi:hypothetical protein
VDVKMLEKVMKVCSHRMRGPDIQLIPVGVDGLKDQAI